MGYAFAQGPCVNCGCLFTFNPNKVPSVRINGVREPVCKPCVDRANPVRVANGLDPIALDPEAYEPIHECELRYDDSD